MSSLQTGRRQGARSEEQKCYTKLPPSSPTNRGPNRPYVENYEPAFHAAIRNLR